MFDLPVYAKDAATPRDIFGSPSPVFRSALIGGTINDVELSESTIQYEVDVEVNAVLFLDLPPSFAPLERELGSGFSEEGDYSVSIAGKPVEHQELEYVDDRRRLRVPIPAGTGVGVSVSTQTGSVQN